MREENKLEKCLKKHSQSSKKTADNVIQTEDINSIVMDALMPEMDGFEASRKIHKLNQDVPIIMLTACQDEYETDPEMIEKMVQFSMEVESKQRELEDHSIAGVEEATRYVTGTSYPENSDYLLFAKEIDNNFGLKDKNIIELCTGPGDLSNVICGYDPQSVLAIDGSEEMIRWASSKHQRDRLEFKLMDIFQLDCKKNYYDLVVCQNSMHHFHGGTLFGFFMAALDCLRPGGVFYISDYRRESINDNILSHRLRRTNKKVRQDLMHTIEASFTREDLTIILMDLGDIAECDVYFPDKELMTLKQDPEYRSIISADPHPHYLDYDLSLRVKIEKK